MTFRRGRRIGIDVGSVRIGVASCDPDGILASPLGTVRRTDDAAGVAGVMEHIRELEPIELVVGRPLSLDGRERTSAQTAQEFTRQLAAASGLPVRLVDERLSTAGAQRQLRAAGLDSRAQREIIDAQAAVVILQQAIDQEKSQGRPAGALLQEEA